MSQSTLDLRVYGDGPRFIRHLESGWRKPSPHLAARIAHAMGVSPWRFLAAFIDDTQDAMCTRAERTLAVVGITAFAQSMPEHEWLALQRDPARMAEAVEAWRNEHA
jgi:hypothetical protein